MTTTSIEHPFRKRGVGMAGMAVLVAALVAATANIAFGQSGGPWAVYDEHADCNVLTTEDSDDDDEEDGPGVYEESGVYLLCWSRSADLGGDDDPMEDGDFDKPIVDCWYEGDCYKTDSPGADSVMLTSWTPTTTTTVAPAPEPVEQVWSTTVCTSPGVVKSGDNYTVCWAGTTWHTGLDGDTDPWNDWKASGRGTLTDCFAGAEAHCAIHYLTGGVG